MSGRLRSASWAHRAWVIALLALCGLSLWLRFSHIQGALPYPNHVDEAAVMGPARRILVRGDLHPGTFNYPSLPKYLAAAGLAGGFTRAARADEISNVRQIGRVVYPYYQTPQVVEGAKQLFALLSVLAMGVTGVVGWYVTQHRAAILVGPLVLLSSRLFFFHSWRYVNVDIVGTCFVALTMASCLWASRRPSVFRSAVIPGPPVWSCGCEQVHVGVGAHTGRTGDLALSRQGATTRSDNGGPHSVMRRVSGGRSLQRLGHARVPEGTCG